MAFGFAKNSQEQLNKFRSFYETMPPDNHLFKGEGERSRLYARFCFEPLTKQLFLFDHHRFFQSKEFDVLYGDIHREFAPLGLERAQSPFLQHLIHDSLSSMPLPKELASEPFEISLHMLRICATLKSKIGRPAPEGIHQDGYHYASIHLMQRTNLLGAENLIHDLDKNIIDRGYLMDPMDSIFFNDRAIFHSVTPFEREDKAKPGVRDMLILLYQPLALSPQPKDLDRTLLNYFLKVPLAPINLYRS